jgi:nickel superoxide dismutase
MVYCGGYQVPHFHSGDTFAMSRTLLAFFASALLCSTVYAHCQVPCGIYGDQLRFEQMLEDTKTITKAQGQINELAQVAKNGQDHNQLARWVATKETHAGSIQSTIADYFLAQRIKPDPIPGYTNQLKAAHAVTVAAMKCKQSTDGATAAALEKAIHDLYRAYEGKEPDLH